MGQQAASGQADQSRREAIDVILIASGSEVHLALEAGRALSAEGIGIRVVSMPSWELFDAQGQEYRDAVLPPAVRARVAIEAGTPEGWEHYIGLDGAVIGMRTFGASAPGAELFEHFGFTVSAVMEKAREVLGR
jgi:transketolase